MQQTFSVRVNEETFRETYFLGNVCATLSEALLHSLCPGAMVGHKSISGVTLLD